MAVFMHMIILCDPDGVVDMTPEALSARTGMPLKHIINGIRELEKPDPKSRSQKQEGRRIVRLDEHREWGWHIVNHNFYRNLQNADDKREKARKRKQRSREKRKQLNDDNVMSQNVTGCHTMSHMSRHADSDANVDAERENHTMLLTLPSDFKMTPELENWAAELGITADLQHETEKFKAHHQSKGTLSQDWDAEWKKWVLRTLDYNGPASLGQVKSSDTSKKDLIGIAKLFGLEQKDDESDKEFMAKVMERNDRRIAHEKKALSDGRELAS